MVSVGLVVRMPASHIGIPRANSMFQMLTAAACCREAWDAVWTARLAGSLLLIQQTQVEFSGRTRTSHGRNVGDAVSDKSSASKINECFPPFLSYVFIIIFHDAVCRYRAPLSYSPSSLPI